MVARLRKAYVAIVEFGRAAWMSPTRIITQSILAQHYFIKRAATTWAFGTESGPASTFVTFVVFCWIGFVFF